VALVLGDDFLAGAVATDHIRVVPLAAHQAIPRYHAPDVDRARRQSVALVVSEHEALIHQYRFTEKPSLLFR
jgi:hypothetical protein